MPSIIRRFFSQGAWILFYYTAFVLHLEPFPVFVFCVKSLGWSLPFSVLKPGFGPCWSVVRPLEYELNLHWTGQFSGSFLTGLTFSAVGHFRCVLLLIFFFFVWAEVFCFRDFGGILGICCSYCCWALMLMSWVFSRKRKYPSCIYLFGFCYFTCMYLLFGEVFGLVLIPVDWIIDILFVFDDLA